MVTRRDVHKMIIGAGTMSFAGIGAGAQAQEIDTLRIAVDALWANMAPINGLSTSARRIYNNFYESFTEVDYIADPDGSVIVPKLATSYERNGKVWTFKMREGVMFHNGVEMTAEDAAFTLSAERYRNEDAFEPRGAIYSEGFVRVEAVDRYTLEIETASEDPYVPAKLSGSVGLIVPKDYYLEVGVDEFGLNPIGTGPYKVTTFRSSEILVMERFDDYWGEAAPVQTVEWRIVPEYAGRMAGVVSGEYDMMVGIPPDQIAQIASYDNVNVQNVAVSGYTAFGFNTRPDPEDNPLVDERLRYAMIQAVDMNAIVESLFGDLTFHPDVPFNFPEYGPYYDPNAVNPLPYDPEAARALVAQTDYDGQPLLWHITRGYYPNYELAAEIMVEMWREVGINVEMQVLDNFSLVYQRPYHLINFSNGSSFIPGDPYQPLWLDWNPGSTRASADWKVWDPTEEYIRLGEEFVNSVDFDERNEAYKALSAEWQRVTPGFYLWKLFATYATRADIEWTAASAEMRLYAPYLKLN
ncbi:ABC transporter substrate-binding protein [Flavimaricola marinus]|uniref:Periplasmic dipeptide transport protein n=1 Tax=Flavimaricola marinus TaxID=1819565 RepID=A0A238LI95_9RHOB|nr:ABC transporter substrate-binding protein [Flavimaricola marinus]SMY09447.1 Periplasmic dipeptide transport protein precursor [Flavimaricola marinus]